jgi:DHA2 family multidrug resistance protein
MADATGLNSLFRQVGGSIGLAVGATLLTRYGAEARTSLAAHVSPLQQAAIDRVNALTAAFVGRGMDPATARTMALRSIDGVVGQQSTLLSFDRVFLLAGISFLLVLPLLWFLKTPDEGADRPGRPAEGVHVE